MGFLYRRASLRCVLANFFVVQIIRRLVNRVGVTEYCRVLILPNKFATMGDRK